MVWPSDRLPARPRRQSGSDPRGREGVNAAWGPIGGHEVGPVAKAPHNYELEESPPEWAFARSLPGRIHPLEACSPRRLVAGSDAMRTPTVVSYRVSGGRPLIH